MNEEHPSRMRRKLSTRLRRLFSVLGATLLTFASLPTSYAQAPRPFTIDDYIKMKWATAAQISPDGSRVLYTLNEFDSTSNSFVETVWVIALSGGGPKKLITLKPSFSSKAIWSPDGTRIAFISASEGSNQILLTQASGGITETITDVSFDIQTFAWSPDGKSLAFIAAEQRSPASSGERETDLTAARPQIHLVEIQTKKVSQLTNGDLQPDDLSWSPDGKHLAFSAQGDIYSLAVDGGQPQRIVGRPASDAQPQWSPDGLRIAFVSDYGKRGSKVSLSVVSADGSTLNDVGQNFDPGFSFAPPKFFGWSHDGKNLFISQLARMAQHLYLLDSTTGMSKPITSGQQVYHDFSLSRDSRTLAFIVSDSSTPDEVYVSSTTEFKPKRLTNLNPQLDGVTFAKSEAVHWKSKDGLEIEGLLLKPVGYETGKRYPLLILMEGTYGSFDFSFSSRVSADSAKFVWRPYQQQIFSAKGYAVLMPNLRGSWGYGDELRAKGRNDFGIGPYNDIMTGVDQMIAQGIADPNRLGIMGTGFDAYRAVFTITQTDRFKAASVGQLFGFNLVSWYGQLGDSVGLGDLFLGGPPWRVPQNYERISPINFAAALKTPTLVFHTEQPPWVVPQSMELRTALKKNNVPVEYLPYPIKGFAISEPRSLAEVVQKNVDWFDRWIKAK